MNGQSKRMIASMTSLLALLSGCGSEDEAHGEDPAEHACEHRGEAGGSLTAAATADAAPVLAVSEEPSTVTLSGSAPGYVAVEGPVTALLFAGIADVVTGLADPSGTDVLPSASPNEHCPGDIPEHFDLDLDEAGRYVLTLGPAAVTDVWLLLTGAEGHAH